MLSKKQLVLSVIILLAILACLTTYMIVNSQQEGYGTLKLSNSCSVSVPLVENNVESINKDITNYSFNKNDLNIIHQKSANNTAIKSLNEKQIEKSRLVEDNIYYNEDTGIYSAFIENNNTSDSILITCKDMNMLKTIKDSVNFTKQTKTVQNTTSNDTANQETSSAENSGTTDTASTNENNDNNNYNNYNYNENTGGERSSSSQNTPKEEKETVVEKGYNDVIRF